MSLDAFMRQEARLIILKELEKQSDGRLNSEALRFTLDSFAIMKSREWVHDELNWLQEMGAVSVLVAGSVRIATLTAKGSDHVHRRIVIEGVKRPSREG